MPVMCIIRTPNVTAEIYDEVRKRVGWEKVPPAGAISHAISFASGEAVEVNVWESRALFDAYVTERLQPVLIQLGVQLGEVEVLDTYNVAVGAAAHEHMLPRAGEPETAPKGPVIALYRRRNIPKDVYDKFRKAAPLDTVPVGALAHIHGRLGDDILSVDVWEDGQAMVDFIKDVIIPASMAEAGDFYWPELVPLTTFVATPAAKAHEVPFAQPARTASAFAAAD